MESFASRSCLTEVASSLGFAGMLGGMPQFLDLKMKFMQSGNKKSKHTLRLSRGRGFSLVELLAVIAIIMLLVGLLVGGLVMVRQNYQSHADASRMAGLVNLVDVLKKTAPIQPDHRLANYYWIESDLTQLSNSSYDATVSPTARRMSSSEFLVFQATHFPKTATAIESLGKDYLHETLVNDNASPGNHRVSVPEGNSGMVLVFEQAPAYTDPVSKQYGIDNALAPYTGQKFLLVSSDPVSFGGATRNVGWRLRGIFDSWGHEILYRYATDSAELNNTTDNLFENIVEDEQLTPPLEGRANGSVRPAVAAYQYPFMVSAGPNGQWGAFKDGSAPAFSRDAMADKMTARDSDARDNIYSQGER